MAALGVRIPIGISTDRPFGSTTGDMTFEIAAQAFRRCMEILSSLAVPAATTRV